MPLNIKNREVEELATQLARATGETKTEAIRKSLLERRDRLGLEATSAILIKLELALRELHGGRVFEPVTKAEWDAIQG